MDFASWWDWTNYFCSEKRDTLSWESNVITWKKIVIGNSNINRPPKKRKNRIMAIARNRWCIGYPILERTQEKSVRDSRVANSACPAYSKSYIFPAADKSNVYFRALVSACCGALLNRGTHGDASKQIGIFCSRGASLGKNKKKCIHLLRSTPPIPISILFSLCDRELLPFNNYSTLFGL